MRTDYENSFGYRAAQLWNILPKSVKETSTLDLFKTTLGQFLDKKMYEVIDVWSVERYIQVL